jgi:hypothetical protein
VRDRVSARGVSSRMFRVSGRVCGLIVCHCDVEAEEDAVIVSGCKAALSWRVLERVEVNLCRNS